MGLKIACVQYRSGLEPSANIAKAYHLAKHVSHEEPDIIVLPEHTFFLGKLGEFRRHAKSFENHPWIELLQQWALDFNCVVVAGSLPEPSSDPQRVYQTAVVTFPNRSSPLFFRKKRVFKGMARNKMLDESQCVASGTQDFLHFEVKGWRIGLTLCVELRYSSVFHAMRYQAGCDVALVPASFYFTTGKHHFLPLLQSRAIEFQMYIASANQSNLPNEHNPAFIGQSSIIDPWGEMMSLASIWGEALCFQELSKEQLSRVRSDMKMANSIAPSS